MGRWLQSRLPGEDGDAAKSKARPRRDAEDEETEDPATVLAPFASRELRRKLQKERSGEPARERQRERADDPATVLSARAGQQIREALAKEDTEDARTVRVSRMPVAFIGESITDPNTALDPSTEARKWRQQAQQATGVDEIDPFADTQSLDPDPPQRTPEPPLQAESHGAQINVLNSGAHANEGPPISTIVLSLAIGAVLGVGAVGIAALLLF